MDGPATRMDRAALAEDADRRVRWAEERAARARRHADQAHVAAGIDAGRGDQQLAERHRREADLHTRAALRQEEAAGLQRRHAEHLRTTDGG